MMVVVRGEVVMIYTFNETYKIVMGIAKLLKTIGTKV
jgi:hypothetical protein